jgi:hypothetical protein
MLFKVLLLGFSLLIAFMYLGAFISVKTESFKYQFLFWILYFVTIITVAQIVACIVIFIKYYNKSGEIGPRGFEGKIGDKGDKGKCEKTETTRKTISSKNYVEYDYHLRLLKIMIQKIFEKELKRPLKGNEIAKVNSLNYSKIKNLVEAAGIISLNGDRIPLSYLTYSELRILHSYITIEASKNNNIIEFY